MNTLSNLHERYQAQKLSGTINHVTQTGVCNGVEIIVMASTRFDAEFYYEQRVSEFQHDPSNYQYLSLV